MKQEPTICSLQETHFKAKDTHILKMRGWNKISYANGNENGVTLFISDQILKQSP